MLRLEGGAQPLPASQSGQCGWGGGDTEGCCSLHTPGPESEPPALGSPGGSSAVLAADRARPPQREQGGVSRRGRAQDCPKRVAARGLDTQQPGQTPPRAPGPGKGAGGRPAPVSFRAAELLPGAASGTRAGERPREARWGGESRLPGVPGARRGPGARASNADRLHGAAADERQTGAGGGCRGASQEPRRVGRQQEHPNPHPSRAPLRPPPPPQPGCSRGRRGLGASCRPGKELASGAQRWGANPESAGAGTPIPAGGGGWSGAVHQCRSSAADFGKASDREERGGRESRAGARPEGRGSLASAPGTGEAERLTRRIRPLAVCSGPRASCVARKLRRLKRQNEGTVSLAHDGIK